MTVTENIHGTGTDFKPKVPFLQNLANFQKYRYNIKNDLVSRLPKVCSIKTSLKSSSKCSEILQMIANISSQKIKQILQVLYY